MGKISDENIKIFIDESLEHLSNIENELLEIENSGADIDENLVNKVYRAAHSIKGGAGFMCLANIKNLTHEMEDVLGKIRDRSIIPDTSVINVLLLASDTLRDMINDIGNSDNTDITGHMESLKSITGEQNDKEQPVKKQAGQKQQSDYIKPGQIKPDQKKPDQKESGQKESGRIEPVKKESKPLDSEINISFPGEECLFSVPEENIIQIRKQGKTIYLIQLVEMKTESLKSMIDDMKDCGVILDTKPEINAVEKADTDTLSFMVLFATILKPADVSHFLDFNTREIYILNEDHTVIPVNREPVEDMTVLQKEDIQDMEKDDTQEVSLQIDTETDDEVGTNECTVILKTENPIEQVNSQTSLRVNIKLLDSLMTLAGELVLNRNQLLQSINHKNWRSLKISGQRIDLITSELQEAIMHTRMQPIKNIFNKFPRVVRDIALNLNKKIDLTIEGKEVELDKSIIESLNDPMTHLIRNSADHGIESPESRIKQGKKPLGMISLKAYHEAGQVNIEIRDDGRGMDGEKIAVSAVAKGLVTEEMVRDMTAREKINLIFIPGFSMSDNITELSGRGVGMDVVKSNLDRLGGIVEIDSEPGKGTTIHIKLPLTLAIIPSLLISEGHERYAIPQVNVLELLRVKASQIKEKIGYAGNALVVRLRNKLLPLIRLADVLKLDPPCNELKTNGYCRKSLIDENRAVNIVVVSTGIFKYGIIVDKLHDSEEIVIKPLGRHLKDCKGNAGATILGDGSVALILDVSDLANLAELISVSCSFTDSESAEKFIVPAQEEQTLLLFRNTEKSRFAVPLELVERIEKIRCCDIETTGGTRAIQYRNTSIPLFDIGDVARVDKFEEKDRALIIVFYVAGMDVGILAIPPIDTIKTAYKLNEITYKQPGISGSAVINGETTLVMDVIGVIETMHPEWFEVERNIYQSGERKTILLAEDTRLFRNQIKCAIEDAGYQVIEAEDGMIAWDLLQKNAGRISLVVTDLEMPNLDGFGFTKKIKDNEDFSHLPVIAVSSLAGKEDIKKAKASGVDEYQIKLDRKKLIECINRFIGK